MLKKLSDKILYAFLASGLFLSAPTVVQADGNDGFSLGVTGGFSKWGAKANFNVSDLSAKLDETAPSLGLAARYTVPFGDGMFAGVHAGFQKDWMSAQRTILMDMLTAKLEIDQTLDLLARVGVSADGVAPYVAAGPSVAWSKGSLTGDFSTIGLGTLRGSTKERHVGFKAVAGMDFTSFGDGAVTPFVQLEYADYGKENYEGINVDVGNYGVRLGLMYNF